MARFPRADNQAGTLSNEPLAVTYLYGEDTETPNVFHFHEQYVGQAGFEAHRQSAHFAEWEVFASSNPFTGPPEVFFFEATDGRSSASPLGGDLFCVNVRCHVKPERRADFLTEISADQRGTLTSEPLAKAMLVGEDTSNTNVFHFHEEFYCGREGFKAHTASPHFQPWQCFVDSQPFVEGLDVRFYTRSGA